MTLHINFLSNLNLYGNNKNINERYIINGNERSKMKMKLNQIKQLGHCG